MKEDKSKLQLIGEIAEANNKNLELIEEINKLSNKIDKAIEYIKINNLYYYDRLEVNVYKERFKEDIDKLLNMLKGSEE